MSKLSRSEKQLKELNVQLKTLKVKYQKSLKKQIVEHKQLLSIFDSIDDPVYVVDPNTYEILFINRAIRKTFGEVIGKKCYSSFQSLEFPCSFCTNDKIFGKNTGKPYVWDFQNRFNRRWYHCVDKAIKWPDGRLVRCEVAIDITDCKKAQEALCRCNRLLEKALYNLRDAVFIFDFQMNRIMDCNAFACDIFGYNRQEILELKVEELFDNKTNFDDFKKLLYGAIEEKDFLSDVNLGMKRKDATLFNAKYDIMPLSREKKEAMGWVCIIGVLGDKKEN